MLILLDMEWIENRMHYFCPTQISAMRVDEKWNCIDRFDALVKPFDKSCQRWEHIAYSGASPEQFLMADAGTLVFLKLFRWLHEDDVLCWWGEQPALVFKNVIGNLLHRNVDHPMRVIYPAWEKEINDDHLKVGSPYRLALDRHIDVPRVEHSSANDVETIRALLNVTHISPDTIRGSFISPTATIKMQADFRRAREFSQNIISDPSQFKLFYDDKKKLLHKTGCPEADDVTDMQGFLTYKSCIQKGLMPCRCCRDEYWSENLRLSQEIIRKCRFNYIYDWKRPAFHRKTCVHARRILFMDLRGGIYYDNCIENGFQPCKWCKPSIKQQIDPPHIYQQQKHNDFRKDHYESEWTATRKLTRDEKVAMRRHAAAKKERMTFAGDKRTKTKTELRDEFILTQTGFAFWSAVGYQNFHLRNCVKLEHVSDLRGYARFRDAIRAGLTPCRECRPDPKYDIKISVPIYQRERQNESADVLDRLCNAQGFKHDYDEPYYYIETTVGKWRLDTSSHPVDVYHINLVWSPDQELYHKQHRLFLSLTDTFEYIRRHELSLIEKSKAADRNSKKD